MANYIGTPKDWLSKSWLGTKSWLRYIFNITKVGNFQIPNNYELVFSDNFVKDYHLDWLESSKWNEFPYHPDFLTHWYDTEQITQSNRGIEFHSVIKPKYFPEIDTTINAATGAVRSKLAWKYGMFIYSAKLPAGTYIWPALWMSGSISWPPEIDLLEGYSNDTEDYDNGIRLLSNVHARLEGDLADTGSMRHRLPNKVASEFVEYVIWWEEDFIKLYYNGYLVRCITDRKILDALNEPMLIIIGPGVQDDFNTTNKSPMIVDKITVYQKQ